ncbi:hypothetical protein KP509_27G006500 [Ceratopteris richardii]|uniref:Protein kinase domain-containing protein n=1 Tax=Ceratopteris richardii TaxID=49495 RepID=A0A8T2RG17_CERRI|nr:hypothetical protein KP509_27G006500 [Ceratopteris richardii]
MRSASALTFVLVWSSIFVTVYGDDKSALQKFINGVGNGTHIMETWTGDISVNWTGVKLENDTVKELKLSSMNLRGEIPQGSLSQLSNLTELTLDNNSLSGSLLSDLVNCPALKIINLAHNNFSGELHTNFTLWGELSLFNVSMNSFTGPIPDSLMHHPTVKTIDMSLNRLSGSIPDFPTWSLTSFDVSNNSLTGALPVGYARFGSSPFQGTSLCGNPMPDCPPASLPSPRPQPSPFVPSPAPEPSALPGPPVRSNTHTSRAVIAATVLGMVIALLVLFLLFFAVAFLKKRKTSSAYGQSTRRLLSPNSPLSVPYSTRSLSATDFARPQWLTFFKPNRKFELDILLEGSAVALREGTLGKSFKVDLQTGDSYVVKQLRTVGIGEGAFREKMRMLGLQQHENLMPITAYFCGREEKLLITEYMENGSLFGWLQDNAETKKSVPWDTRIRIAVGAAKGIKYLHEHNLPHGRIKSSNVLLSNKGDARLSDYGLAEIVLESEQTGYPDTQIARTGDLRFKQDIHDFGLLLSQLFQIELASSSTDAGNSEVSPNFAEPTSERGRKLSDGFRRIVENCLKDSPDSTPTIQEVVKELRQVEIGDGGKGHCFPAF